MKCSVCGEEAQSYSMADRKYEPCGHIDNSESAMRSAQVARNAINFINKIWNDIGKNRSKRTYTYWQIPKSWKGARYQFGYTPWKTRYNGKQGFFAVKYRETKKRIKLVKAVRFGKRKIARERSLQWFNAYYKEGN